MQAWRVITQVPPCTYWLCSRLRIPLLRGSVWPSLQAPSRTVLGLLWVPTDTLPRGNVQTDPLAVVCWRVSLSWSHHWLLSSSLLPLVWLPVSGSRTWLRVSGSRRHPRARTCRLSRPLVVCGGSGLTPGHSPRSPRGPGTNFSAVYLLGLMPVLCFFNRWNCISTSEERCDCFYRSSLSAGPYALRGCLE